MLAKKYKDMLSQKSVIRELSEFATARGKEIGYENVFDYSLGNPSIPVPEEFTNYLIKILQEKNPVELHGYSPSLGITEVKEKLANSLNRRFGMNYTANTLFMTSGAAGAIAHAVRCVTEPGDIVLTFAPFFSEYNQYINQSDAVLKAVPPQTSDFQINFDEFIKMLTPEVAAVLINTPNNPSGVAYSEETLEKLAEILEQKSEEYGHIIYLISDEPYREIIFDGIVSPYPAKFYKYTLTCYSFSKSLSLPGERIGYVAVHPDCPDAETMVVMMGQISRGIGHNCPASIFQLAVADNADMTADLSIYEDNMNILYDALCELGFTCVRPNGTFYILPKALEEDSVAFCKKALKYDLVFVPADAFGCPGYFRIAYCTDTDKVKRSITALKKFVEAEYPNR